MCFGEEQEADPSVSTQEAAGCNKVAAAQIALHDSDKLEKTVGKIRLG